METKIKELLEEYSQLAGNSDTASETRKDEILAYIEANHTEADKTEGGEYVAKHIAQDTLELKSLREQANREDYKLLPLSYIAKEYFDKSSAWLLQRLNGYPVRGRVYTLNAEQKSIFNRAVSEIGQRIGSLQLA